VTLSCSAILLRLPHHGTNILDIQMLLCICFITKQSRASGIAESLRFAHQSLWDGTFGVGFRTEPLSTGSFGTPALSLDSALTAVLNDVRELPDHHAKPSSNFSRQ
jgi:hypothetical protein